MILIREMVLKVGSSYFQASVCKMMYLRILFRLIDIDFINKSLECNLFQLISDYGTLPLIARNIKCMFLENPQKSLTYEIIVLNQ